MELKPYIFQMHRGVKPWLFRAALEEPCWLHKTGIASWPDPQSKYEQKGKKYTKAQLSQAWSFVLFDLYVEDELFKYCCAGAIMRPTEQLSHRQVHACGSAHKYVFSMYNEAEGVVESAET
jgi:hypothetical protein